MIAIVTLGGFIIGFDAGVIVDGKDQISAAFNLTTFQWSIITSLSVLGALLTVPFGGKLVDKWGAKTMLIVVALGFAISLFITAITTNLTQLVIGRFITGICIGIAAFSVPLFISETSPPSIRGGMVLSYCVAITAGQTFSFFAGYLLHDVSPDSWRIILAIETIAAVCFFIGMIVVPQSPQWRAKTQRIEKTRVISKKILPVLLLGMSLAIFQQFVGINAIIYYGPVIFQAFGFHTVSHAIFATFLIGLVNLIFTSITAFLVDYMGRRFLLLLGTLMAGASMLVLAFPYVGLSHRTLSVIFLMTYIIGYCISLGSVFWVLIAEIYPCRIRGFAMSLITALQYTANFIVTITFLKLFEMFDNSVTFSLFGGMCLAAFIFIYFYVPETKGVQLETIESNLNKGKKTRELGQR